MFLAELDGTIGSLELAGDQESDEESRSGGSIENVDNIMLMMGRKDEGRLQAWEWPPRVNNVEKYDG